MDDAPSRPALPIIDYADLRTTAVAVARALGSTPHDTSHDVADESGVSVEGDEHGVGSDLPLSNSKRPVSSFINVPLPSRPLPPRSTAAAAESKRGMQSNQGALCCTCSSSDGGDVGCDYGSEPRWGEEQQQQQQQKQHQERGEVRLVEAIVGGTGKARLIHYHAWGELEWGSGGAEQGGRRRKGRGDGDESGCGQVRQAGQWPVCEHVRGVRGKRGEKGGEARKGHVGRCGGTGVLSEGSEQAGRKHEPRRDPSQQQHRHQQQQQQPQQQANSSDATDDGVRVRAAGPPEGHAAMDSRGATTTRQGPSRPSIPCCSSLSSHLPLWQQWHYDYGLFTALVAPLYVPAASPSDFHLACPLSSACPASSSDLFPSTAASGVASDFLSSSNGSTSSSSTSSSSSSSTTTSATTNSASVATAACAGLHVWDPLSRSPVRVELPARCVAVQVGEAAQVLSGGRLRAAVHCVVRPGGWGGAAGGETEAGGAGAEAVAGAGKVLSPEHAVTGSGVASGSEGGTAGVEGDVVQSTMHRVLDKAREPFQAQESLPEGSVRIREGRSGEAAPCSARAIHPALVLSMPLHVK
ncbi:unnamed protein product [Closterium sp. Naga37s-1]|nr:unnamed protein product [Closterium sp. Naga37s-1]